MGWSFVAKFGIIPPMFCDHENITGWVRIRQCGEMVSLFVMLLIGDFSSCQKPNCTFIAFRSIARHRMPVLFPLTWLEAPSEACSFGCCLPWVDGLVLLGMGPDFVRLLLGWPRSQGQALDLKDDLNRQLPPGLPQHKLQQLTPLLGLQALSINLKR